MSIPRFYGHSVADSNFQQRRWFTWGQFTVVRSAGCQSKTHAQPDLHGSPWAAVRVWVTTVIDNGSRFHHLDTLFIATTWSSFDRMLIANLSPNNCANVLYMHRRWREDVVTGHSRAINTAIMCLHHWMCSCIKLVGDIVSVQQLINVHVVGSSTAGASVVDM